MRMRTRECVAGLKGITDMTSRAQLLTGMGLGFGVMYLLDPERGNRRRAAVRDTAVHGRHAFWTMYDYFPRFMSRVLEVRPSAREGQSRWRVEGPGGMPIEFDAEVTESIPNEIFAWRTIEGSIVGHAGVVHFEPTKDGGTRLHIRMSYNPPGGWFGHGVARAFGVDPKKSLDADLARMKTYLETARPPHDAAQG